MLERGQYAFRVNKEGTWFFTISISTTDDKPNDNSSDRQLVVGQLARIPKSGSSQLEVLLRIDNFVTFPKGGEKESKIQV